MKKVMTVVMVAVFAAAIMCTAASAGVIYNYKFQLVGGKPGVIPGPTAAISSLGVTNDGVYIAAQETYGSYTTGIRFYSRNDVTAYDNYGGLNSAVGDVIGNNSNGVGGNATDNSGGPSAGNDARNGSAASAPANFTGQRVTV